MFTPRNVSQLLVAKTDVSAAFDAASTAAAKKATLVNVGDYAVVANPNVIPAAAGTYLTNNAAGLIVKTSTGLKVSEQIDVPSLDSYTESTLAAGVAQQITLTYPAVSNSITFVAKVILHDHIGSMLNERFADSYVSIDSAGKMINSTGVKVTATLQLVLNELKALLQATLDRSSEGFVVTNTATTLTVLGAFPAHKIGATDGIANIFEVEGGTKNANIEGQGAFFEETATAVTDAAAKPDDLVQLKNLEWFISGYEKDPYRQVAFPADFTTDNNVSDAGIVIGDKVGIYQFHKDRDATNVERQHRQLIVVGKNTGAKATGTATLAGASGSIDGITVGGVEIMSGAESFATSAAVTATAVAANITANTSVPNYTAAAVGAVITITAAVEGAEANGLAVATSATIMTSIDVDMAAGTLDGYSAIDSALKATTVVI